MTIERTPIYKNTAAPFFLTDDVPHRHNEKHAKEYSGGGACIQNRARATFKQCKIYSNTLISPNNKHEIDYATFGGGVAAGGDYSATRYGQAFFEGCDIYDNKVASRPHYKDTVENVGGGVYCAFVGNMHISDSCTVDASTKIHDNFATEKKGTLTPNNVSLGRFLTSLQPAALEPW